MRGDAGGFMKSNGKMPWWLVILTGALILAAGVFLLAANSPEADKNIALKTLLFLVGLVVFAYGVFNLYKAVKLKNDHRMFVAHLIHGILDIVLLLLILIIRDSQALLGIILACWFIVFGLFGLVQSAQNDERNIQSRRISALLLVIGLALLIVPLVLGINEYYILLLGIAGIVIGAVRIVQGIIQKARYDDRTSGGRSNLY
jgi:uncharacterized membrane protein HdeD (DUF308 family)